MFPEHVCIPQKAPYDTHGRHRFLSHALGRPEQERELIQSQRLIKIASAALTVDDCFCQIHLQDIFPMTDYGKVDLYGLVRTGLFDGRGSTPRFWSFVKNQSVSEWCP